VIGAGTDGSGHDEQVTQVIAAGRRDSAGQYRRK